MGIKSQPDLKFTISLLKQFFDLLSDVFELATKNNVFIKFSSPLLRFPYR